MTKTWIKHTDFQLDPQPEKVEYVKHCQAIMTCFVINEKSQKCIVCKEKKLCENLHQGSF